MTPRLVVEGSAIDLTKQGRRVLQYGLPYADDANGTELPVKLSTSGKVARLTVDTTGAVFPVVVDPLLAVELQTLPAVWHISLDGDTLALRKHGTGKPRTAGLDAGQRR